MAATRNDSTIRISPPIDFEGHLVKPDKRGFYRCPYACGDARFPARKWKTEAGFRKHMGECGYRPSAVKARLTADEARKAADEIRKAEALATCPYKIGQRIHYVREVILKPTHEPRFGRMARVRYEAVKRFDACEAVIESIGWNGQWVFINYGIDPWWIVDSAEAARTKAAEAQRAYDEHVRFSEFCR